MAILSAIGLILAAALFGGAVTALENPFTTLNGPDPVPVADAALTGAALCGGAFLLFLLGWLIERVALTAGQDLVWVEETELSLILILLIMEILLGGAFYCALSGIMTLAGHTLSGKASQALTLLITALVVVVLTFLLLLGLIFLEWFSNQPQEVLLVRQL